MKKSNPYFRSLTKDVAQHQTASVYPTTQAGAAYGSTTAFTTGAGYDAAGYGVRTDAMGGAFTGGTYPLAANERAITVDDIVSKTGLTLALIVIAALVNFQIGRVNPFLAMGLTMVGMLVALGASLYSSWGKRFGSPGATITYAISEGFFVGGFTLLIGMTVSSKVNIGFIVAQAILGTLAIFAGMLIVYRMGAVRVTPKFTKILVGSLIAVMIVSLIDLFVFMFSGVSMVRGGGVLAIAFSLICIGLGAMSFVQDFETADHLVRVGAPSKMAWGVALGLAVTLVWLYTEILRLISYFLDD